MAQESLNRFKNDTSYVTRGIIWYSLIISVISFLIISVFASAAGLNDMDFSTALESDIAGYASAASVLIGVAWYFSREKKKPGLDIFVKTSKKMSVRGFLFIVLLILGIQGATTLCVEAAEAVLNPFGFSLATLADSASAGTSGGFGMLLYVGIVGPVAEELVYRGFVLKRLQKYGKLFAIVISALFFGIMHVNPIQVVFGTAMGLLLGYLAVEHSIFWSIFFHIFNNLIMTALLTAIFDPLPSHLGDMLYLVCCAAACVLSVLALIIKRGRLYEWSHAEGTTPGAYYIAALTTPSALVFLIFNLMLMGMEVLSVFLPV